MNSCSNTNNLPPYYDPLFKQRVIEYYLKNRSNVSLRFVSDIFQIKGGHKTVKRWFDRYDGTIASLQQRPRSGRPPILNQRQVGQLIVDTVRSHNRLAHVVHYPEIARCINQKIDCNIFS